MSYSMTVNVNKVNPIDIPLNENYLCHDLNRFLNMTVEQQQLELSTTYRDTILTHLLAQTKFAIAENRDWLSQNCEKMRGLLEVLQNHAIKTIASKLFQHQDLTVDSTENKALNEFRNLFTDIQDMMGLNLYIPMGHEIYLSPIALLMHLPKHLIYLLNPYALQESLIELSKNNNHCLYSLNDEISLEDLNKVFYYFNRGLDISPIFGRLFTFGKINDIDQSDESDESDDLFPIILKEFKWIMEQPLFQYVPINPQNFYQMHLEPFEKGEFEGIDEKNTDEFCCDSFKIEYLWNLSEILGHHPIFNTLKEYFEKITNDIEKIALTSQKSSRTIFFDDSYNFTFYLHETSTHFWFVFNKLFENILNRTPTIEINSSLFFSACSNKRKLFDEESKSSKRLKTLTSSSSSSSLSSSTPNDSDGSSSSTLDIAPFILKLPQTIKLSIISDTSNTTYASADLNNLLNHYNDQNSLNLPIELFSLNNIDFVNFKNTKNLEITVSTKTFAVKDEKFEQQLLILKKIPFKKLNIQIYPSEILLNFDRLIPIIQLTKNSFEIYFDNKVFYPSFFSVFYKIDQLELKDQIKLLFYSQLYNSYINTHEIDYKIQDHLLYHIISSYPYDFRIQIDNTLRKIYFGKNSNNIGNISNYHLTTDHFKFSNDFLKDPKKIKFLIQRFFDNPAFLTYFSSNAMQLLNAAIDPATQNYQKSEDEMEVDLEEGIPQSTLEYILLELIKNFSFMFLGLFVKSPKLFNWILSKKVFLEQIPTLGHEISRLLANTISIYPQIEENWLTLLQLSIKYQKLNNISDINKNLCEQAPDISNKILVSLQKGIPLEVERNIKALLPLAPTFAQNLLISYDDKKYDIEELNNHLSLFFKNGWIPPIEDRFTQHRRFPFLYMNSLTQALPNLKEAQKKWVSIILTKLADKPELSLHDQENYMQLFNYHCAQKKRPLVGLPNRIFLYHYPYLFDQILSCYISELASEPAFAHLGMQLITIALSQKVEDDVAARKIVTLLESLTQNITDPNLKLNLFNLLKNAACLPFLLKQAYIISKKGDLKLIKQSARPIIEALCLQNTLISREVEYLLAHSILELKSVQVPLHVLQKLSTTFYDIVEKRKLKEVPKNILIIFFENFESQLNELVKNPDEKPDDKIMSIGMNIIQFLFHSQELSIDDLSIFKDLKKENPSHIQKIIISIFDQLVQSSEFVESVMKNKRSMIQFFKIGLKIHSMNTSGITLGFRCWKSLYFKNEINSLFPMPCKEFMEKVLKYMVKYPDKFLHRKEVIKYELLKTIKTIRTFDIPLNIVSNVVQLFLNEQDTTTLFWLGRNYPNDMKSLLGRELTHEELNKIKISRYYLDGNTLSSVQALIKKPVIPTQGNHTEVDIKSLIEVFSAINFSNGIAPNFCNPNDLKIDNKVVPVGEVKEYIHRLIQNTLKTEKITAAPEDPVIRKQFYDEVHNHLKHIAYLLKQKEPHKSVGYLLSLAEIGSKCATQYQELPSILHCIMQESEEIFVPCSIPFPLELLNNPKEKIDFLLKHLPSDFSNKFQLKIEQLNLSDSPELVYQKISITWLLAYLRQFGLNNASLEKLIEHEIVNSLEGNNNNITKQLKSIICRLHALDPEKIKEFLGELVAINFDSTEIIESQLAIMEKKAQRLAGLIQPQGLKDHLLLYLHDERWKYFRQKLAKLPDVLETNVHNYKYIFQNISKMFMIYEGHDCKTKYVDTHILPQAKEVPEKICDAFQCEYNILSELPGIKKFLQTKAAELTDWFKANTPVGKNPQQFLFEIYDEDFINIKDEWIFYMLEKMNIVKARN